MDFKTVGSWIALGLVLLVSCGGDQVVTRPRALNRPTDIAFACVKLPPSGQAAAPTVVKPSLCRRKTTDLSLKAPDNYRTLGFVPSSGTGEVGVAGLGEDTIGRALLFDLDARIPGYNFLPVGRLPSDIETSRDGCEVVVLNQGSCDLSLLDVGKIAQGVAQSLALDGSVVTVAPHTSSGPILARPYDMVLLPMPSSDPEAPSCGSVSYHALIAYPSCDLVAEIDVATGNYLRGFFVRSSGIEDAGASPACPNDCVSQSAAPSAPAQTVLRATSLVRSEDGKTVFVAGSGSPTIWQVTLDGLNATSVDLTACLPPAIMPPVADPAPRCDPKGVSRLRLGPLPGEPPEGGPSNNAGLFLYAATLDQTVRVLQVEQGGLRECETQADPQVVAARWPPTNRGDPYSGVSDPLLARCLPLDESTPALESPPLRRGTATGPGIRIPGIAIDIAFAQFTSTTAITNVSMPLDGTFAYVLASSGDLEVVNLDSHEGARPEERALSRVSHQQHNVNGDAYGDTGGGDALLGAPRYGIGTLRQNIPGDVGAAKTDLPQPALIGRHCPGDPVTEAIHFPDLVPARPETFTFTFEGAVPSLTRSGAVLGSDTDPLDAMSLSDSGARYCGKGVFPGDFVILGACQDDEVCATATGQRCFGATVSHPGICLQPRSGSVDVALPRPECQDVVGSRHEYRVNSVSNGTLILDEKPLYIPRPGGCTSDDDCKDIDRITGGAHLFVSGSRFICDPDPGPGQTVRQCVLVCNRPGIVAGPVEPNDEACAINSSLQTTGSLAGLPVAYGGYVCGQAPIPGMSDLRRCVSARILRSPQNDPPAPGARNSTQDCFNEPVFYETRAGLSFVITGDRSGYRHNSVVAQDGTCTSDPTLSPKRIARLSYNAPPCSPQVADGYDIGERVSCIWDKPMVAPNPCLRTDTSSGTPILVWQMQTPSFEAAIGPARPALFGPIYSFSFAVQGGYRPADVVTGAALPTALRLGPGPPLLSTTASPVPDWLYVVDVGDLINASARTLLLGQVLRYDAASWTFDPNTLVQ